ncbi:MAG TPA: uracil-DNA glycosylase [Candidatus Angelobacter sp.]|jgi:uracil-DNA glycosylase family 4|nr:uracil-DNA glycosylase [Candidatus Angelobacter sp.]
MIDAAGGAAALDALHDQIRACVACPLSQTRIQAVPGDGPVTARIMAVGEAPGETEDRIGKPFIGSAGQLLTKLLESVGLQRSDLYICNVLKCRPPGNRDPLPEEVEACAHFLDAQVELIRPDVILLLGRHALQRILPGAAGISRSHGTRIRDRGRLYVPLYHPAAALYNGSLLATLQDDMRRVRGYLDEAEAERARTAAQAMSDAEAEAVAAAHEQLTLF